DAVDPGVRALQHRLGVQLGGAHGGRRVGREERVAEAGGEDDDPALLEVADRAPPDVGLGDAGHLERRLDAGCLAEALQGVLEREGVDHRAEHAHVVGLRLVHADAGTAGAAPDVAAADHDGDVDVELGLDGLDLPSDLEHDVAVDGVAVRIGERLSRQLQDDALPARDISQLADLHLGEADDGGLAERLLHRLLLVVDPRLLEQHATRLALLADPLEPALELALDDLGQRRLGLALVARGVLEDLTLLGDVGLRHLVLAEDGRAAEADVQRDLVRELVVAAGDLDEHAVDAALVLDVEIGVEAVALGRVHADDAAPADVLLEADRQLVEARLERVDGAL